MVRRFRSARRRSITSKGKLTDVLAENRGIMIGAPLIVVSLLAVIGATVSTDALRHSRAVDPATLCPVNRAIEESVIVAVDRTDPLAASNEPQFHRMMVGLGAHAARRTRLTIVPFSDDIGAPLNTTFDVCSPGRRRDADTLTESGALIESAYREKFAAPLEEAVRDLTQASTAPRSPITEQIERIARDRTLGPVGVRRRIIVVSDFLQNTPAVSVYRGGAFQLAPPGERFLEGVSVQLVQLGNSRDSHLQTAEVRREWEAWFREAGATIEDVYLPPGEW